MTGSVLEAAYMELLARVAAADRRGDWRERSILSPLADVADHVKRVGDHADSAHYRADKSGPLVEAALWVQRETFLAYAGWPDDDHAATRTIEDATKELATVIEAVRLALWSAAASANDSGWGPGLLVRSDAEALTAAVRDLAGWAERLAAHAVDDPEEW